MSFKATLIPFIASWVSPKFALAVSRIVNNYINKEFNQTIAQKDDKIDELMKRITTMEASMTKEIQSARLETKLQGDKLCTKIDKLQKDIEEVYKLCSNKEYSNEVVVIYREPGDPKTVLRIRAGKKDYIERQLKDAIDIELYENIANSKEALRHAKEKKYLPKNGNAIAFEIPKASDRKKIRNFIKGIDARYQKAETDESASYHTCEE